MARPRKTTQEQPPGAAQKPQADEPAASKKKPGKQYRCFFCGEDHESQNEVGHISFSDGEHERKVYVCHYCASRSLEDLLAKADPKQLQQALGEIMYLRALDSRAW